MPEPGLTEEEIHAVVEQGAESGVVPEVEHDIVDNVFRLGDRRVSSVMTARPDIEWIDVHATPGEIRDAIGGGQIDWFLVCEDDVETVRGIVHTGRLFAQCLDGKPPSLESALEEPLYVPATTPVFKLLDLFRGNMSHVAIVLDEYGGIEGMAALTDILSALVDSSVSHPIAESPMIVGNADGSWTVDGSAELDDVEEAIDLTGLEVASRRGYRTLGGFIMAYAGRVPKVGDAIAIHGFEFRVESLEGRRVARLHIRRIDAGHSKSAPPTA